MPRGIKAEPPDAARDELRERLRAKLRAKRDELKTVPKQIETERDKLIREAFALGVIRKLIEQDAGLSHARVFQIKNEGEST